MSQDLAANDAVASNVGDEQPLDQPNTTNETTTNAEETLKESNNSIPPKTIGNFHEKEIHFDDFSPSLSSHIKYIPNNSVETVKSYSNTSEINDNPMDVKFMLQTVKHAATVSYVETMHWKKHFLNKKYVWTFLTICGILGGIIIYCHDLIVLYMYRGRLTIINQFDEKEYFGLRLFLWVIYSLFFVTISLILVVLFGPYSEGSGISLVKAMLNGANIKGAFGFRTFLVKIVALPMVLGSGMFLGDVGSSAHVGALLTYNMMRLPIFRPIKKVKALRDQMIACGCALGVGANFATPGGSVLFALEAICTYYSLRGYLKSFYVAIIASFVSRLFDSLIGLNLNVSMTWHFKLPYPSFSIPELIAHAILGFLMGLVGVCFLYLTSLVMRLRLNYGKNFLFFKSEKLEQYRATALFNNQALWTLFICIITGILTFPNLIGKYMSLSVSETLEALLSPNSLSTDQGWIINSPNDVFVSLSIYLVVKFCLTLFTLSLQLPGGLYIPIILIGAGFGRFFGEIVAVIFPNGFVAGQLIKPGAYAVIGIVSLTSSTTHTFSTVFIFLEMIGVAVHLPCLMVALISVQVSRAFTSSVYDIVIRAKNWKALLENVSDSVDLKASNLMINLDQGLPILETKMKLKDLQKVVKECQLANYSPKDKIPMVENLNNLLLLGQVSLSNIEILLEMKLNRKQAKNGELPLSASQLSDIPLEEMDEEIIEIEYESCEFTISEGQPIQQSHMLFSQLSLNEVFVVWKGRLMGKLTRDCIINHLEQISK
ncbi:chloride channel protein [Naegleria gruberi]|uniref:Chloride channel protein n=1 Tax=Naegleria gruberi TaxID=5762 RepID=D2V9I4_NAEGR|nr:chloride channel protein [Naegleria gruberi]EFC46596.1 chloride channel protein [Naegleria gruberi]|eukprot:XP_002679340.1 chloride channel protein [Naegleria gruberi strain NEG-M]